MRKKKLLLTIFACVVIAVLVLPAVTSILNSHEAAIAPNPEPATGVTLTSDGGGPGSKLTEVVSTESTAGAVYPSLAVDSSGNVHVAWEDLTNYGGDADNQFDIFYKRYVVGSGWTTTEVVSRESTAGAVYPSLAVDSSGTVHVAWHDLTNYGGDTDGRNDVFYKRYVPGGGWSATEVVSTESTAGAEYPSLAVDSSGNVHVAWDDWTNYGSDIDDLPDIFYKRYVVGSGWSATEVVSTESTAGAVYPSLAVDSSGNVHVAWEDWTNYGGDIDDLPDIFYKRYVVGSGWITTEVVSTETTFYAHWPSLAADSKGNIHIAWEDMTNYGGDIDYHYDIFYKRYVVGVGWSATEVVSTESTFGAEHPSLSVDSSGNVHVAWKDFTNYGGDTDNQYDIFYNRYVVGSGWSATEVVSTESTASAYSPTLAVDSSGNIHVAWHDYTNYGGDIDTLPDIFYKWFKPALPAEPTSLMDIVRFPGAAHRKDLYEATYPPDWSTLTATEMLSKESTANAHSPSLAVDSSGNVHVAWADLTNYGGDSDGAHDVFYKRYVVGSGWSATEVVSTESTAGAEHPSLAVDLSGNIHIAWQDLTNYDGDTDNQYDIFYKRSGPDKYYWLTKLTANLEGLKEVRAELESKGFIFAVAASNVSRVDGGLNRTAFSGTVLSWWSSNMDRAGRMAFIVAAMMDDGQGLVFGAVTNLIPPEILLLANQYVIVNAMPYTSVEWFYYDAVNNRIAKWSYWWYDSQYQPDWFWNIYWKWRNYINEYYGWNTYLPWWWWFWHYIYDKQWHNWAAESPH